MITTKSVEKLTQFVSMKILEGNIKYIGIDGKYGVGKTSLAKNLSKKLEIMFLSLDNFIYSKQDGYVDFLNIDSIKSSLKKINFPIIIEGICLLAAIERIGIELDLLIYIKRMSHNGYWVDEEECNPSIPVEKLILMKENEIKLIKKNFSLQGFESLSLSELEKEIIRYHGQYRPVNKADFIYEKLD